MKRMTKQLYRTGTLMATVVVMALIGCAGATVTKPQRTPDVAYAKRWWNVLNAGQREAALYGTGATSEQERAAQKEYGALDAETKKKVDAAARELYGDGNHESVGAWWQTLDCREKRIAVGDGNTADPASPYCAEYPKLER